MVNLYKSGGSLGYRRPRKFARRARLRGRAKRAGMYHNLVTKPKVKATVNFGNNEPSAGATYAITRSLGTGAAFAPRDNDLIEVQQVLDRAQYVCYNFASLTSPLGLNFPSTTVGLIHGYRLNVSDCAYYARWLTEYNYMKPFGFEVTLEPLYGEKISVPQSNEFGAQQYAVEVSLRNHLVVEDSLNSYYGNDQQNFDPGLPEFFIDPRRRSFTTQVMRFYVPVLHRKPNAVISTAASSVEIMNPESQTRNNQWYRIGDCGSMFGQWTLLTEMVTAGCDTNLPTTLNSLRMFRMRIKLHCQLARDRVGMVPTSTVPATGTVVV